MSTGEIKRIIIIGAGQAGGETAQRLRQAGFDGDITLIGEEPSPPYQRPPLSKAYLKGELPMDRLLLRPSNMYAEEHIALLTPVKAVWVDRANRKVRVEGGRELSYDALVLATKPDRASFRSSAPISMAHFFSAQPLTPTRCARAWSPARS